MPTEPSLKGTLPTRLSQALRYEHIDVYICNMQADDREEHKHQTTKRQRQEETEVEPTEYDREEEMLQWDHDAQQELSLIHI